MSTSTARINGALLAACLLAAILVPCHARAATTWESGVSYAWTVQGGLSDLPAISGASINPGSTARVYDSGNTVFQFRAVFDSRPAAAVNGVSVVILPSDVGAGVTRWLLQAVAGATVWGGVFVVDTRTITATKVSQWETAYGWGDHSTKGYLTGVTDISALLKAGGAWQITLDEFASGVSRVFDKSTDTLDNITDGTAYKRLPAATKTQLDSLLGNSPYQRSAAAGITAWEGGTTVPATSGNLQLVEGANITIDIADDGDGVRVTIASTAAGGSGSGVTRFRTESGDAEASAIGDAPSGIYVVGAQGLGSSGSGNTLTMTADGVHSQASGFARGISGTTLYGSDGSVVSGASHFTIVPVLGGTSSTVVANGKGGATIYAGDGGSGVYALNSKVDAAGAPGTTSGTSLFAGSGTSVFVVRDASGNLKMVSGKSARGAMGLPVSGTSGYVLVLDANGDIVATGVLEFDSLADISITNSTITRSTIVAGTSIWVIDNTVPENARHEMMGGNFTSVNSTYKTIYLPPASGVTPVFSVTDPGATGVSIVCTGSSIYYQDVFTGVPRAVGGHTIWSHPGGGPLSMISIAANYTAATGWFWHAFAFSGVSWQSQSSSGASGARTGKVWIGASN